MNAAELREVALTEEEYRTVVKLLGREPNRLELGIIGAMWSEHCGYKNSRPLLRYFPTEGEKVVQGPGENAGAVAIDDKLAVVFKVESHNHPSAIEPYQGAATGVGGIVRDIFTMGARPIALLNSLRFGPLSEPENRRLLAGVVKGIGDYGNSIGIPTVGGEVWFHPSYNGNPLVNAMCVGVADINKIVRAQAGSPGNLLLLVGADTGRDGIHGATFASVDDPHTSHKGVIQVGNPFMEKLLMEACLELLDSQYVVGMQDLGAAGLTSSSVECAGRAGSGVEIDVSKVSRREFGMTPYEVMLSESQERMLIVVRPEGLEEVKRVFEKWDLHSDVVGIVTPDGMLRVRDGDEIVGELPIRLLTEDVPRYVREATPSPEAINKASIDVDSKFSSRVNFNPESDLIRLLSAPNIASKRWIWEQYDHTIGTSTMRGPGSADAAVMRVRPNGQGVAITMDCNPRYCYLDPYCGGMAAVIEAARNLACVGAVPIGMTNCLNFGNPEKPEVYWQLRECILGMSDACKYLQVPVVSGNVSLYNESNDKAIYPTPVVGLVGLIESASGSVSAGARSGDTIYLLHTSQQVTLGASEWLAVVANEESGHPPVCDLDKEIPLHRLLVESVRDGVISAAHDLSDGGLLVALAEMAIIGGVGIDASNWKPQVTPLYLFGEGHGRALVSAPANKEEELAELCGRHGVQFERIGVVGGDTLIVGDIIRLPVGELIDLYDQAIPSMLG